MGPCMSSMVSVVDETAFCNALKSFRVYDVVNLFQDPFAAAATAVCLGAYPWTVFCKDHGLCQFDILTNRYKCPQCNKSIGALDPHPRYKDLSSCRMFGAGEFLKGLYGWGSNLEQNILEKGNFDKIFS